MKTLALLYMDVVCKAFNIECVSRSRADPMIKVGAHEGTGRRDLLQGLVPCRVYTVGQCCGDKSLEVFT